MCLARSPRGGMDCKFAAWASRGLTWHLHRTICGKREPTRLNYCGSNAVFRAGAASFPRTRCLRKLASIKSQLILTKVATLDRRSSRASIASDESIAIFADLSGTSTLRLPQQPLSWMRVAGNPDASPARSSILSCERPSRSAFSKGSRLSRHSCSKMKVVLALARRNVLNFLFFPNEKPVFCARPCLGNFVLRRRRYGWTGGSCHANQGREGTRFAASRHRSL